MSTLKPGTWTVDPAHTTASFMAHDPTRWVPGTIPVTAATIEIGAHGQPVRLAATMDPAGINTVNARRDKDLQGKRFLRVAQHPVIEVDADRFEQSGNGWTAQATLRVGGTAAPLPLDGTVEVVKAGRIRITGTGRLDIRTVGIRVPGFMVRRHVTITVIAELTQD